MANLNLLPIEERLSEARSKLSYTQDQVVDVLNVFLPDPISLSLYRKWEQGSRPVGLRYGILLAKILQTNLKELFVPESDDYMIGEVKYVPKKPEINQG